MFDEKDIPSDFMDALRESSDLFLQLQEYKYFLDKTEKGEPKIEKVLTHSQQVCK